MWQNFSFSVLIKTSLKDVIPKPNQEEIKLIYISSCEMLKSYHAMFPPKNTEQQLKVHYIILDAIKTRICLFLYNVKLKAMRDTLENYYQQKCIPFHERLSKENFVWNVIYLGFFWFNFDLFFKYLKKTNKVD